jgi:LuxR family transcriptional regulator, maltose regulon positive regulatory protein
MLPKNNLEGTLSEREIEVLQLLAEGNRNKDVADKLFVSVATVKSHIYSIYQKLHVNSRVAAINKFRSRTNG